MKGSDYRAFVLKGSEDSGFEIVHPSHSKMEQEEDITEEEYQVPSAEKTATKQHDLKNEEKEDKMSEEIVSIFIFSEKKTIEKTNWTGFISTLQR